MSTTLSPDSPKPASPASGLAGGLDLFASMRPVQTTLRHDLQITRTMQRGQPLYVFFDPVSFRSHRLTASDYEVVTRLQAHRTLQHCFDECVTAGILDADDERQFFVFVKQLSAMGLLTGQSAPPKQLYERFAQAERAAKRGTWLSLLFLTIPLANPDKFLGRTLPLVRFLYTLPMAIVWAIGLVVALAVVSTRWTLFWEPLNGLLAVKNLAFMALAFLGLKVWHELGHGYACKLFGGRVPEMGCKLIVGMPLAYVDASAAWSFPRRRDRILVMLGGMYFELLLAVPAALLWAYWPHSALGACAYQIVFMSGVATILFNINPLMKYDGYFILGDMLGISNLQARSVQEVKRVLKARVLGIVGQANTTADARDRLIFLVYGISSSIYSWILMLSIAAVIASRVPVIGLYVAAIQILLQVCKPVGRLYHFLWHADEVANCRGRAKGIGIALAVGITMLVAVCPVPTSQCVSGVVSAARLTHVRASTPGFVDQIVDPVPEHVEAGQALVRLRNVDVETNALAAGLSADAARRSMHLMSRLSPADEASQLQAALTEAANHAVAQQTRQELNLPAPHAGRLANILPAVRLGTLVQTGEVVATIAEGATQVRAWLNEEQLATARLDIGSKVSLRLANDASRTYTGTIHSIAPANKAKFEDLSLTTVNEGSIPIDPITRETREKVFQLLIDLPELPSHLALQAVSANVHIPRRYEPLGHWAFRQTARFVNTFWASSH